jgi:hypothetical protein
MTDCRSSHKMLLTQHIISHKTCYDILRCGLKLNINLNHRDQFCAEISSQSY